MYASSLGSNPDISQKYKMGIATSAKEWPKKNIQNTKYYPWAQPLDRGWAGEWACLVGGVAQWSPPRHTGWPTRRIAVCPNALHYKFK
jgi:hypothetical protein